jgi:hypothetical protein
LTTGFCFGRRLNGFFSDNGVAGVAGVAGVTGIGEVAGLSGLSGTLAMLHEL